MLITLLISSLVLLLSINLWVRNKRLIYRNELRLHYDKLEFQFLKEGVALDNSTIRFLQSFKSPAEHPDFLDIQVLWVIYKFASKKDITQTRTKFDKVQKNLSEESLKIIKEFNKTCDRIVALSMLRPDFVVWAIGKLGRAILSSVLALSVRPVKSMYQVILQMHSDFHVTVSVYNMPKYHDARTRMSY